MRGLLLIAAALASACSRSTSERTRPPAPNLEPSAHDPSGAYWCTIDDETFDGRRYACEIRRIHGTLMLGKLSGEVRIRGSVSARDEGFAFDGEVYCTWTDCTRQLRGVFEPAGQGAYLGTFPDDAMIVRLVPAPANAFGGAGYGGSAYGDPFVGSSSGARGSAANPFDLPRPPGR
jgi:hypothetical protein